MDLLQELGEDDGIFCGPPAAYDDEAGWLTRASQVWAIGLGAPIRRPWAAAAGAAAAPAPAAAASPAAVVRKAAAAASTATLERHRWLLETGACGAVAGARGKFLCVLSIGLEDDDPEFALVKRLFGRAGANMIDIVEGCPGAKLRLRGLGSGYLEGTWKQEANIPLQLHVSCTHLGSFTQAVSKTSALIQSLHTHHRRYLRAKGGPTEQTGDDDAAATAGSDEARAEGSIGSVQVTFWGAPAWTSRKNLEALFQAHGYVREFKLLRARGGSSWGAGHCVYGVESAAGRSVEKLDGSMIDGCRLTVVPDHCPQAFLWDKIFFRASDWGRAQWSLLEFLNTLHVTVPRFQMRLKSDGLRGFGTLEVEGAGGDLNAAVAHFNRIQVDDHLVLLSASSCWAI